MRGSAAVTVALLATTSAVATAAAVPVSPVSFAVDWPSFLARADPVWNWTASIPATTPNNIYASLFGGNGDHGFYMYADSGSTLRVEIGRTSIYDDRRPGDANYMGNFVFDQPRLPIGYLQLSTSLGPITAGLGRLDIYNGVARYNVTTVNGTVMLTLWAHAQWQDVDVIVVDALQLSGSERITARFVPEAADSTWSSPQYVPNPAPVISTSSPAGPGSLLNLTSQNHLRGSCHTTADAVVPTSATRTTTYISVSLVLASQAQADAAATAQVMAAYSAGPDALLTAHTAWWNAYWPQGGAVTWSYSLMEAFWYMQIYKFASATRQGHQIFDLQGPWWSPGTDWPDTHWDMNLQQVYWLPTLANRLEQAQTLIDFLYDIDSQGHFNTNVPPPWQADSAAPTGASSLSGNETAYWDYCTYEGNAYSCPPSITGNLLWALQLVDTHRRYTGGMNASLTTWMYSLLDRALQAYQHFQVDGGANVSLPTTFSPEYPGPQAPNANYDLSLYRWGLKLALSLNGTSPHIAAWSDTLSRLVPYSVDDTLLLYQVYEGIDQDTPHRHYSHLFMVHPLRGSTNLSDVTSRAFAIARNSVGKWLGTAATDSEFYRPAASSMSQQLRDNAGAFGNLTFLLHTRIDGNTMYHEGGGPCQETPPAAAWAMANLLAQGWNTASPVVAGAVTPSGDAAGVIEFYPGIDDVVRLDQGAYIAGPANIALASFYRLRVEGGFLVSGSRRLVASNATHYVTTTDFVAVESTVGGRCFIRTNMARPLTTSDASVTLVELGDAGIVEVVGLPAGGGVAIYSATAPPATFAIGASAGCPADFNFWGWPYAMTESVGDHGLARATRGLGGLRMTQGTNITLRQCQTDGSGYAIALQRFTLNATTGQLVSGDPATSGMCLAIAGCDGASGTLLTTAPCAAAPNGSSTSIGCDPSPANCANSLAPQSWTFTGSSGTPPFALINGASSSACVDVNGAFDPDHIDVWSCDVPPGQYKNQEWAYNASTGAITSLDTDACCLGLCMTVTPM